MTVIVRAPPTGESESPSSDPYRRLHPAAAYTGAFYEEGKHWDSVALYCLAQRLLRPEDRERIRTASDLAKAAALAATLPEAADADRRADEGLRRALTLSFERNLPSRAVLLGTGDEPIEAQLEADAHLGIGPDGRGENLLGRALMEVRAQVRVRAADPAAIQCEHQSTGPEDLHTVCEHRLSGSLSYRRHFTGVGTDFETLCEACCAALPAVPPRRRICGRCLRSQLFGPRGPDVGSPAIRERVSTLRFSHRAWTAPSSVVALAAVPRVSHTWLMLDGEGRLSRVDVERGTVEVCGRVDGEAVDLTSTVLLVVAPGGDLVVVAEASGLRAVVMETASGAVLRSLVRGEHHAEHCRFPLGFFELDGRLLLVHGTDWNRLDVRDPRTGELLTSREYEAPEKEGEPVAHALDYFHSDLHVSPDGAWVIDNGWVWHPRTGSRLQPAALGSGEPLGVGRRTEREAARPARWLLGWPHRLAGCDHGGGVGRGR